jgi:hypothetical protein
LHAKQTEKSNTTQVDMLAAIPEKNMEKKSSEEIITGI